MTRSQAVLVLEHWLKQLENKQSIFISHHDKTFQEAMDIALIEMERTMYEDKEVIINDDNKIKS